jgi:hypothetical protein
MRINQLYNMDSDDVDGDQEQLPRPIVLTPREMLEQMEEVNVLGKSSALV